MPSTLSKLMLIFSLCPPAAVAAPIQLLDILNLDLSGWPEQDADPGPEFGAAISADGDWLLAGLPRAIRHLGAEPVRSGAAALYRRREDQWQLQQILSGPLSADPNAFEDARCGQGVGIAIDDPYLAAVWSCPFADGSTSQANSGMVWLGSIEPGALPPFPSVVFGNVAGDQLGYSLAITRTSDGVVFAVAGAPGGAYAMVFRRPAGTAAWMLDTVLSPGNGTAGDRFGHSVAIAAAGSSGYPVWVAVGAPQRANLAGSVYVFRYAPVNDTWSQAAQIVAPGAQPGDLFGAAVAYQPSGFNNLDDLLAVGAPNRFTSGDSSLDHRRGTVSVFRQGLTAGSFAYEGDARFNAILCTVSPSLCEDTAQAMQFGAALAFGSDGLWIGAPSFDQLDGADVGRVYLAQLGPVFGDEQWWIRSTRTPGTLADDCQHDPNRHGRSKGQFGRSLASAAQGVAVGYPRRGCELVVPPYDTDPRRGQVRIFGVADGLFKDRFESVQ